MARVDSVKEQHNSMLPGVIKSMALGGVVGYAAKYALPLTKQEMDNDYWKRIEVIRRESKGEKAFFIDEIRKLPKKTVAQDTFIKMVDKKIPAVEIPEHVDKSTFNAARKRREFINSLSNEVDRNELKQLVRRTNERVRVATAQHIDFYNKGLKGIRQSTPFVAFGIIVGFVAGVAYNVMKSPLKDA